MEQKFVDILEEHVAGLKNNQDILSTIGELNKKLKEAGWDKKAEQLITDVFYNLRDNKGGFDMKSPVEFLKVIPTGLKTRQLSDEDIKRLIPENDWKYFRPQDWIDRNTRVQPHG